jgi:Domain of unknown function (DUF5655)
MATPQTPDRWVCGECGRTFLRRNETHSCRAATIESHLLGKPEAVVALFHAVAECVRSIGPFEYSVSPGMIGFRGTRRVFAGVKPGVRGLSGYLDLPVAITHERLGKPAPYTKTLYVSHFELREAHELDDTFRGWLEMAYAVGQGARA